MTPAPVRRGAAGVDGAQDAPADLAELPLLCLGQRVLGQDLLEMFDEPQRLVVLSLPDVAAEDQPGNAGLRRHPRTRGRGRTPLPGLRCGCDAELEGGTGAPMAGRGDPRTGRRKEVRVS